MRDALNRNFLLDKVENPRIFLKDRIYLGYKGIQKHISKPHHFRDGSTSPGRMKCGKKNTALFVVWNKKQKKYSDKTYVCSETVLRYSKYSNAVGIIHENAHRVAHLPDPDDNKGYWPNYLHQEFTPAKLALLPDVYAITAIEFMYFKGKKFDSTLRDARYLRK